ncbi:MAG TPA: hypothetical protein PL072_01825 [Phycisphaerales bacterium]|nr:hypothetical protein [Phycisphaerales bacterium]
MSRGPRPNMHNFERRPPKPTLHPRKVVGGVRLQYRPPASAGGAAGTTTSSQDAAALRDLGRRLDQPASAQVGGAQAVRPETGASDLSSILPPGATGSGQSSLVPLGWTWASSRWMRLAEEHAPNDQISEGLEYARLGQTKSLEIKPGLVSAKVQGRLPTPYRTELRLPTFGIEAWNSVVSALAEQSRILASLLSGELPSNIEDVFAPLGLRLFPGAEQELATSCSCHVFRGLDAATDGPRAGGPTRWCKHVCCVMYLVAEALAHRPLTVFGLRGLEEAELLEQLRQQRALSGLSKGGGGAAPVYVQHVPPSPALSRPLEEVLRAGSTALFFSGPGAGERDAIDLSVRKPEVTHPLLRRLGATPFKDAKFPLVGLLATCYDLVSEAAIREAEAGEPSATPTESRAGDAAQSG